MLHLDRLLEKRFGGDSEELDGAGRSVFVEQRLTTELCLTDEFLVFGSGHFEPGAVLLLVIERRYAIDIVVGHIEYMRELVQNHVAAIRGLAALLEDVSPRQDDRSVLPRLAETLWCRMLVCDSISSSVAL